MSAGETPFVPDSRGCSLEKWAIMDEPHGTHVLWLRGPEEVATQLITSGAGYTALQLPVDTIAWTHALRAFGAVARDTQDLLALLATVVTLPRIEYLDIALALEFYKIPDKSVDAYQWRNTHVGQLVNVGKYRFAHDAEPTPSCYSI